MQNDFRVTRLIIFIVTIASAVSCSPISKKALTKNFNSIETSLKDHTGFFLYDVEKKKEVYSYQGNQYFTPASNTKILTFYTCLNILGDSVPSIQYIERGDSLIFRGMADPSMFYREAYDSRKSFEFLRSQNKKLFLEQSNFSTETLGPGWAWDDTQYIFSVERSALPLFGNFVTIDSSDTTPSLSSNYLLRDVEKLERFPADIPFKTSTDLAAFLLSDTLKKRVEVLNGSHDFKEARIIKSTPVDSLYKVMMQESDNFIAEELLLMCSAVLNDTLKPETAITYMQRNFFNDLPDSLLWVDGSGLSRYNLFTPASIVKVWEKIYEKVPRSRLFPLLAIGGKTGTIKNYFKNDPPYIYGKTGTLSNNHSLSGYLITRKGHTLIFSFMSNNYPTKVKEVRPRMEKILKDIYLHY